MSLEVTGKLLVKYDALQVSEKFKKREFVIELAEEINGNIYTNCNNPTITTKIAIITKNKNESSKERNKHQRKNI